MLIIGGDGNAIPLAGQRSDGLGTHKVLLVEDPHDRNAIQMKLFEDAFYTLDLMQTSRVADVNDVEKKMRIFQFFQRGAEGCEQFLRQLADESNRISNDHLSFPGKPFFSTGRV